MRLSEDKQRAELEIQGTFDAAKLETLIGQLSALRSAMVPPVPAMPPMTNNAEDAAAARARGDPFVQVAVMRDGLTRFWVRHGGLGWFGFNLPVERASMLATHILDITTSSRGHASDFAHVRRRESDVTH
jgi:hypothetical protein